MLEPRFPSRDVKVPPLDALLITIAFPGKPMSCIENPDKSTAYNDKALNKIGIIRNLIFCVKEFFFSFSL